MSINLEEWRQNATASGEAAGLAGLMTGKGELLDQAREPGPATAEQRYLMIVIAAYLRPLFAEGVPLDAEVSIAAVLTDLLDLAGVPLPEPVRQALAARTGSIELVRQLTDAAGLGAPTALHALPATAINPGWQ